MTPSIFCSPSRYVQGRNVTLRLGEEMKKMGLGGPALIVASRSPAQLLAETWRAALGDSGIAYELYQFGGECSLPEIAKGRDAAQKAQAQVIIGAGGGKVLDAARAVAAELDLPVVNCPTIASSDAPCSALSVVYTPEGEFLEYRFYRRNPELVLVDSAVIARSPLRYLVSGMGDAVATWFEAKTVVEARKSNQVGGATTISAAALAELCYRTLLNDGHAACLAVETATVTPALERIIEANTLLSGVGFESGGLAVAHSVHNGLTTASPTHTFLHGEKVAFGVLVQLVLEGRSSTVLNEVLEFSSTVGLPTTLADVGLRELSRDQLDRIAQRTVAPGETAHNEPFEVSKDMVADAILAADAIGRDRRRAAT